MTIQVTPAALVVIALLAVVFAKGASLRGRSSESWP